MGHYDMKSGVLDTGKQRKRTIKPLQIKKKLIRLRNCSFFDIKFFNF